MYRLILYLVQGQKRSTSWGCANGVFLFAVLCIICIYWFVSVLLCYDLWHLMQLCVLKVRMSCLSLFWTATSVLHARSSWCCHYLDFRSSLVNVGHHLEVGLVSRATWSVAAASSSTCCALWHCLRQLANRWSARGHVTGRQSAVEVIHACQSVTECASIKTCTWV